MALHRRLLQDIAEIQQKPYPNITYRPYDSDITKACLVLTPDGYPPLHLTVNSTTNYPLQAPRISIQSSVYHPNIIGGYICASILNTAEGWTSAYTLKGICIQLLSFFGSETLEQMHGGGKVNLREYKLMDEHDEYTCYECNFATPQPSRPLPPGADPPVLRHKRQRNRRPQAGGSETSGSKNDEAFTVSKLSIKSTQPRTKITDLPDEILILICSHLETEELIPFSRAWNRIGTENGVMTKFKIIQNRELICFTFKRGIEDLKLGIGVHIELKGRIGGLQSEFDLLSEDAFEKHSVRRAVQGKEFEHWLPLAISRRHYNTVKPQLAARLGALSDGARYPTTLSEDVIYGFMSDIVVRLSRTADTTNNTSSSSYYSREVTSTLNHASEKAIESYYHLFHLLLCLAIDDPLIVRTANKTIQAFLDGKTSKQHVPNLGHLLIAVLISDADMTPDLLMAIVRETITRNVVWMLDKRGANMPELAYMEADRVSAYRLQKTFDASLTSYRLLMFQNTFRKTINRGTPTGQKTLVQLRDELFDAHGAPPPGTAAKLANDIKQLQQVKTFPTFLENMGLTPPLAADFTTFLRRSLEDSVKAGYSRWGISQKRALTLRKQLDPDVIEREKSNPQWNCDGSFMGGFFPNKSQEGGKGKAQRGRR